MDHDLVKAMRSLPVGCRVRYRGWRGDSGEGVFLGFVWPDAVPANVPMTPRAEWRAGTVQRAGSWGVKPKDGLMVKRDFSADDGRIFLPFAGDGDFVEEIK